MAKTAKAKTKSAAKAKSKSAMPTVSGAAWVKDYQVVLSPIVTEKSAQVGGAGTTVVFKVDPRASKTDIKAAVQRIFNVLVAEVRTANFMGKPKRTMRSVGRRAAYKKAYVTLKEGQKIDLVEGL